MRTYLETQPRLGGKVGVGSFSEGVTFKLVPKEDYYPSANVDPSLRWGKKEVETDIPNSNNFQEEEEENFRK